ncbi:hypothetical protein GOARA_053_00120 [Gordonia araii NBRC 100433]|uniref:DUF6779 domain-containing protein n=1 Tax=Gordonia araii NBRC 100433 TaxID=1073574 RepID=G7H2W1_9ACTN|nr:DUF6779 domain-containing protein [Gordonia araii]NNG98330.1 hypothetical protein [Gordonia araii NBRC 100433]GAB10186.1 hypothetical protein GOARA_053_00120 [Gordonia araii NBRC 100433]
MARNSRSADARTAAPQRGAGQWLLGLLIVLALVASAMMIWSDQLSVPASIAVISALWAAVIGAIGVTRYRRQAEIAESKSRDMRLVYELQLEREISARRQYEMDVEAQIRREVAEEASHDLQELQAQVAALRASLEALIGQPLPEDRVALPNERLRELASSMPTYEPDDSVLAATDFASTAPPTPDGRHYPPPPPQGGRDDWTEIIPVVEDEPAPGLDEYAATHDEFTAVQEPSDPPTESWVTPSRAAGFGADDQQGAQFGAPEQPAQAWPYPAPTAEQPDAERRDHIAGEPHDPFTDTGEMESYAAELESEDAETDEPAEESGGGGRRRAEGRRAEGGQHEQGISAAELLNQLRQSQTGVDPRRG